MLKIMRKKTYEDIMKRKKELMTSVETYELEYEKMKKKLNEALEKIEMLSVVLEEEKDKYKTYMKQVRKQNTDSAKKWLNGYPDE